MPKSLLLWNFCIILSPYTVNISPYSSPTAYNIKFLNCVCRNVIFRKIQSCDKKFLFLKQFINLSDVDKVMPNKSEPISDEVNQTKLYDQSSKTLDTRNFLIYWMNTSPWQKISNKFSANLAKVGWNSIYFSFTKITPKLGKCGPRETFLPWERGCKSPMNGYQAYNRLS